MAELVIDEDLQASFGPIENKPPEQKARHYRVVLKLTWQQQQTSWDHWNDLVSDVKKNEIWKYLGYGDFESLLEAEGIPAVAATTEQGFYSRHGIMSHGGDRRSVEFQDDNYHLEKRIIGSTGADYLTARIARDRPDILDKMKAGEYRSVRQAAIDAGIVKDRKRISMYKDPESVIAALRRHFGPVDLALIIDGLQSSVRVTRTEAANGKR